MISAVVDHTSAAVLALERADVLMLLWNVKMAVESVWEHPVTGHHISPQRDKLKITITGSHTN